MNDWVGRVGDMWAQQWRRTDRSLAALSAQLDPAIAAAAPAGAFRALDIGCGAAGTSLALLAARSDAEVTGIDLSRELLAVARRRVDAVHAAHRVTLIQGDAATLAGQYGPFDLLMSRHGVMFFPDPHAAFAMLHRAARPDAALVFSCFRDWRDNGFFTAIARAIDAPPPDPIAPGPFAFADRDRVAAILAAAGWREATAHPVDFAYRAGQGEAAVDDATDFLTHIGPAAARLREVPENERPAIRGKVRAAMADHADSGVVDLAAAAWIWTARA